MRRALLLASLLSGCATDFTEQWEVKEPRLFGARIEAAGDPNRPRPRLGESFAIRQYLALPGPLETPLAQRYSMDIALCLGFQTPTGELGCFGEQQLSPVVQTLSENELLIQNLSLDPLAFGITPDVLQALDPAIGAELENLDRLALFGALCVEGRVERVPGTSVRSDSPAVLFRCVDNAGARYPDVSPFTLSVLLDRGRPFDQNRNPSFACDPAAPESACTRGLSGPGEALVPGPFVLVRPLPKGAPPEAPRELVAWSPREPSQALPWQGCAEDPSLPKVRVGSGDHELRIRLDGSDREPYQYEIERNGTPTIRDAREALLVSSALSTEGGELSRYFSELREDRPDAEAELSLTYTPPPARGKKAGEPVAQNGRLVRFYFTLRDQRGGVDFTTRELCLLPGE